MRSWGSGGGRRRWGCSTFFSSLPQAVDEQTLPSSSQAVRPSLAFGRQPPSSPVMCACAAPSQVTEPRLFSPRRCLHSAQLVAHSPQPPTPTPRYESPRFPAGARAFARAWRGLSRPLIFGDKSLVRVGGGRGRGRARFAFPLPTIPPFSAKAQEFPLSRSPLLLLLPPPSDFAT